MRLLSLSALVVAFGNFCRFVAYAVCAVLGRGRRSSLTNYDIKAYLQVDRRVYLQILTSRFAYELWPSDFKTDVRLVKHCKHDRVKRFSEVPGGF